MLTQLTIQNFAIVRFLELDLKAGMTCITGETGAGKSIAIDALGLCLGERAEVSMLRPGSEKAEVIARFDIRNNLLSKQWLISNDLEMQDECILRRVITNEGRSRAYINGTPVPLGQLKQLGSTLINIHGQHAHQLLLKPDHQLNIIDAYANHPSLVEQTRQAFQQWRSLHSERARLKKEQEQRQALQQLLEYQVEELEQFALSEGEFEQIEMEYSRLANSEALMHDSQLCLQILQDSEDSNIDQMIKQVIDTLSPLSSVDSNLKNITGMLSEAKIQIEESYYELRNYLEQLEMDPERFQSIEKRLSQLIELARKHQVKPAELFNKHQQLKAELHSLCHADERLQELAKEVQKVKDDYLQASKVLSASRKRYSEELSQLISKEMKQLNMPEGRFEIIFHESENASPTAIGIDLPEFQVSTNPGQPLQCLGKVASGGELSRISLAIQVITAQKISTPSLIFDEVDVGISGNTAAVVGRMLRQLGESTQVIVVTHLPQVAGNGHQQYLVEKQTDGIQTETSMLLLDHDARLNELARLLGGDIITTNTLANAKELLIHA